MTALAPHLTALLQEHLPRERRASPATLETYAHALRLLVCFAAERLGVRPSRLKVEQLDAPLVLDFLRHLEAGRGNSARTRNARLAAVNALFRYLEYRLPASLDQARRIHAIPAKRTDEALVRCLAREEIQALLDAPDPRTPAGVRDRAMLYLAFAAGLRVSELVGLRLDQLCLAPEAMLHVMGKGRRERVLPLWRETVTALRAWLAVRDGGQDPALFLNAVGRAMTSPCCRRPGDAENYAECRAAILACGRPHPSRRSA
jgi:integrase/recombinase XerD